MNLLIQVSTAVVGGIGNFDRRIKNFSLFSTSAWLPTTTHMTTVTRRNSPYHFGAVKWPENDAELGVVAVEERERDRKI
jgi:hypothetical protein